VDTTSGRPYDSEARSSERLRALQQNIEREIGLDPNLPLAYSAQGQLYLYTWRWTEALRNYRIAIDKGRGDLAGNQQYGLLTAYSNRTAEGITVLQQALDGEANSAEKFQTLGILQAYTGDYDGALTDLGKALELTPTNPLVSNWIAYVEIARGNTDQALRQLDFSRGILGDGVNVAFWAEFAYAYHRLSRPAEAEQFRRDLLALSAERPLGAGTWATMSLALGDNDKALEWLEIAAEKARNHEIDAGFWTVMNLKMNFLNDPLLNEPRFADVLGRIRGD
jgi:tetratricopeptide (TPR) repeat protein